MKYSEFETIAKKNGWEFGIDEDPKGWVYVSKYGFKIKINKSTRNYMDLYTEQGSAIGFSEEKSFIEACYELAGTPIEDREDEKEYYLRHMFLGAKSDDNYLNMHTPSEQLFLSDKPSYSGNMYKTRFTERELEKIEDGGFDLRNFELVEVEDEI